jgi:hypothetical protein
LTRSWCTADTWGTKADFEKQLAAREPKALELFEAMEEVKEEAAKFMKVRAVWQFFEAEAEGQRLDVFRPAADSPLHTISSGRRRATGCASPITSCRRMPENAITWLFL